MCSKRMLILSCNKEYTTKFANEMTINDDFSMYSFKILDYIRLSAACKKSWRYNSKLE